MLLTLFLALAVVFGGTHAYAFAHGHDDAHAGSELSSVHSDEHVSNDQESTGDSPSTEIAHSHVAMGAIPDSLGVGHLSLSAASLLPIRDARALPSLGVAPPLEPPSA